MKPLLVSAMALLATLVLRVEAGHSAPPSIKTRMKALKLDADELDRVAQLTRREAMSSLIPRATTLAETAQQLLAETVRAHEAADAAEKDKLAALRTTVDELAERLRNLASEIEDEAEDVTVRSLYDAGICGVYNVDTGKVEWRQGKQGEPGVTGAYDAKTRRVVWSTIPRQNAEPHQGEARVERDGSTYRSTCTFKPAPRR